MHLTALHLSSIFVTFEYFMSNIYCLIINYIVQLNMIEGDNMDVLQRITVLTEERGWSSYKLAQQSGLSLPTIANIYRRNTVPSIATLESICKAFGITLCQFFSEDIEAVPLTQEQKRLFDKWASLTSNQKEIIEKIIDEFN